MYEIILRNVQKITKKLQKKLQKNETCKHNLTSADEIDMSADQETAQQNDACFSNKERPNT